MKAMDPQRVTLVSKWMHPPPPPQPASYFRIPTTKTFIWMLLLPNSISLTRQKCWLKSHVLRRRRLWKRKLPLPLSSHQLRPRAPQEIRQEQEPQEQEQEDQLEQERVCFLRHSPHSTPPLFRKNTQILLLMQVAIIHHQSANKRQHHGALRPGVMPGRTQIESSVSFISGYFLYGT